MPPEADEIVLMEIDSFLHRKMMLFDVSDVFFSALYKICRRNPTLVF